MAGNIASAVSTVSTVVNAPSALLAHGSARKRVAQPLGETTHPAKSGLFHRSRPDLAEKRRSVIAHRHGKADVAK